MDETVGSLQRYAGLAGIAGAWWGLAEASWLGALTGGVTTMAVGSGVAMLVAEPGTLVSESRGPTRDIQRAGGLFAALFSFSGAWIGGWEWGWAGAIGGYLSAMGLTVAAGVLKEDRDSQSTTGEARSLRYHEPPETDGTPTTGEEGLSEIDRCCKDLSKAILQQLGNRHEFQFHNHSIDYTPGYGLSAMALTALDKFQAGAPLRKCWVHFLPDRDQLVLTDEDGEETAWTISVGRDGYRLGRRVGSGSVSFPDPESVASEIADRIAAFMASDDASVEGSIGVQGVSRTSEDTQEGVSGQADDSTPEAVPRAATLSDEVVQRARDLCQAFRAALAKHALGFHPLGTDPTPDGGIDAAVVDQVGRYDDKASVRMCRARIFPTDDRFEVIGRKGEHAGWLLEIGKDEYRVGTRDHTGDIECSDRHEVGRELADRVAEFLDEGRGKKIDRR